MDSDEEMSKELVGQFGKMREANEINALINSILTKFSDNGERNRLSNIAWDLVPAVLEALVKEVKNIFIHDEFIY